MELIGLLRQAATLLREPRAGAPLLRESCNTLSKDPLYLTPLHSKTITLATATASHRVVSAVPSSVTAGFHNASAWHHPGCQKWRTPEDNLLIESLE